MNQIEITREPSDSDRQKSKELFCTIALIERAKQILPELTWVLLGRRELDCHEKVLPDYCYNIFDVFQKTYFKGFPLIRETLEVTDPAGLPEAKTLESTKKVLRLDWKNLGRVLGIGLRSIRFADLEAESADGLEDSTPQLTTEFFEVLMGKPWVDANKQRIETESSGQLTAEILQELISPWIEGFMEVQAEFGSLAYQWSPAAMAEFNEGLAEGMTSFLDENGQPAGESSRSGIYVFLLLVRPEIKAMLESNPKKTISDLHEWMQPFMRLGVTAYIDIETLRDVCAPPPSGIGLSLRPLSTRRQEASA